MADSDLPSTSTGRRDHRGMPTVPAARGLRRGTSPPLQTPRRQVRRRLDTSAEIRSAVAQLSDAVSSDDDEFENVASEEEYVPESDDSDFEDRDFDDPAEMESGRSSSSSSPPAAGGALPAPSSPPVPLAQSTPRRRGNRPAPPPTGQVDPTKFVWTEIDDSNPFVPNTYNFSDPNAGFSPRVQNLAPDAPISEYFHLFFDDTLMDLIVSETNSFFEFRGGVDAFSQYSPAHRWKDSSVGEMYVFLALTLLMPMVKKHSIKEYWKRDCLTYISAFGKYMTRDRYLNLLSFMHFADNNNVDRDDSMFKVRKVFDDLMAKFRTLFRPDQKVVIDESLVLFRGRVSFRQYIRTKRHRFGLKIFVLCDCRSGSVLDMILYTGKTTNIEQRDLLGVSGAVVKELLSSYLGEGRIVYLDNWYTSPLLCQYLHENNTGTCGTVREDRKYMAKFPKNQRAGQVDRKKCENVLAVKWKDKRSVTALSTLHTGAMQDSGKKTRDNQPIMKPDLILDYNINMRLVDKSDMMIGDVECVRRTVKWYKKLFFHLVDVVVLNSYIYYKMRSGKKLPLRIFVHDLVYQLLEKYGTMAPMLRGRAATALLPPERVTGRDFVGRHHLVHIPLLAQAQRRQRSHGQRQCVVCSKTTRRPRRKKTTSLMCNECQAPLCMLPCFVEFHTYTTF